MQNSTWRPERRNRKIGTAASGFSKSNNMRIPESWLDKDGKARFYYERAELDFVRKVSLNNKTLRVLYEIPRAGFTYGCSPSDVIHLLSKITVRGWEFPELILFRQPTRKQTKHYPVWGRFLYYAEIGGFCGPAVILEAQKVGSRIRWPNKCSLESRAELERLKNDGHCFESCKREQVANLEENAVRNTILYRTILHELGHWVQYQKEVLSSPAQIFEKENTSEDIYFSKPSPERECFAHRFADDLASDLKLRGLIPFSPIGSHS